MRKHIYRLANDLQHRLLEVGNPLDRAPRVILDAWASLWRWHDTGERTWRITSEHEDALMANPLPSDLPLATAKRRGPAVAYQLPDRRQWIVLAYHDGKREPITVLGPEIGWSYSQPILTFATMIDDALASGYYNLTDQPTPADLHLRPGTSLRGALTAADIVEEDYRVAIAITDYYTI